jgi:hypothetical protein
MSKFFSKPQGKRISWQDVPKEDWEHFCKFVANGCGANSIQNKYLEKYLFGKQKRASCDIHDWLFQVGGDVFDFIRANFAMLCKQVEDACELRSWSMILASFIYFSATMTVGAMYFNWGDYKTIEQVCYK